MMRRNVSKAILEIKNLNMVFSKRRTPFKKEKFFHVLKNINLDIYEGEILAVVGESGCGKTTLGKIITGLLKPTSGEINYYGKNISSIFTNQEIQDYHRYVQFVQQDSYAALNPVRTIYQSLEAPIRTHYKYTTEQINQKVDELMSLVGLTPADQFLGKFPHQLSGGQRQRILMARALSLDPKLIVADEPVSMIDVSLRLQILELMSRLNKELGVVFIYITHDLSTARYIARDNRMMVMYLGEIMEIGKATEIINNPRHPYTQALLSAVPIPDPNYPIDSENIKIKGMEMGDLSNRPIGCSFFERCPYAQDCCKEEIQHIEHDNVSIKCIRETYIPKHGEG